MFYRFGRSWEGRHEKKWKQERKTRRRRNRPAHGIQPLQPHLLKKKTTSGDDEWWWWWCCCCCQSLGVWRWLYVTQMLTTAATVMTTGDCTAGTVPRFPWPVSQRPLPAWRATAERATDTPHSTTIPLKKKNDCDAQSLALNLFLCCLIAGNSNAHGSW